jgi:hypothetical protein
MHPLDGARLKIIRAEKHLQSFNEEAGRYLNRKLYRFTTKQENNLTIFTVVPSEDPPPELSCIVGDCVTNIRASLDYIAWALVPDSIMIGLIDSDKQRITFPILKPNLVAADFPGDNRAVHLRDVCRVATKALGEIQSVQPYNAGYEVLHKLSLTVNHDKHRTLLLCIGCIPEAGKITIRQGDSTWYSTGSPSIGVNLKTPGPGPVDVPSATVEMEGESSVFVTFKNPPMELEIVRFFLANAIKCVADIIPRFDQFFS